MNQRSAPENLHNCSLEPKRNFWLFFFFSSSTAKNCDMIKWVKAIKAILRKVWKILIDFSRNSSVAYWVALRGIGLGETEIGLGDSTAFWGVLTSLEDFLNERWFNDMESITLIGFHNDILSASSHVSTSGATVNQITLKSKVQSVKEIHGLKATKFMPFMMQHDGTIPLFNMNCRSTPWAAK